MDLKNHKKEIDEYFNNPKADEYFDKIEAQNIINEHRFNRLESYVKTIDFNKLVDRLMSEHSESYIDKCYSKGYEPYPNNKLSLLFDYVNDRFEDIKIPEWIDDYFPTTVKFYKGYYFCITHGQGSVSYIYNSNKEIIINV